MKTNSQKAFTLLEVLIAITLTALVLGSLFAMQSQSKQLAFRSLQALERVNEQRAVINSVWAGIELDSNSTYQLVDKKLLEVPDSVNNLQINKQKLKYDLQQLWISHQQAGPLYQLTRMIDRQR